MLLETAFCILYRWRSLFFVTSFSFRQTPLLTLVGFRLEQLSGLGLRSNLSRACLSGSRVRTILFAKDLLLRGAPVPGTSEIISLVLFIQVHDFIISLARSAIASLVEAAVLVAGG